MSGMEPDMKVFLLKIASSISMIILWMLINTTVGIGFNMGFFTGAPTARNYIFYAWFILSLVGVYWYLRRKWKA
jgi:hypothetical protein